MIVKKMIRRFKENGIRATIVHYYNIVASFFINRIRSSAKNVKFFLPLKNYILFECESDMDDNPRAVYEYMVESNFTSQELNPQKYILDLWDSEVYINKCKSISFEIGLSTKELMNFLIEHNKINFVDIFALWDSGAEPVDIANEFGLEISDVQSFLKENIDKLKRKSDLWQLDIDYEDYYEDWI